MSAPDWLALRVALNDRAAIYAENFPASLAGLGSDVVERFTHEQAESAVSDLLAFPITVFPTGPLLGRVWELRHNLTAYDACYVSLAEAVQQPLLTADRRLANAPGLYCQVEAV